MVHNTSICFKLKILFLSQRKIAITKLSVSCAIFLLDAKNVGIQVLSSYLSITEITERVL